MGKSHSFAVFGLGRYGRAVAKELAANGEEVLAVDISEDMVNSVASELPFCKCADITDAEVLRSLDVGNIDTVIIAMASNLEASVMATILCKEAGVKTVITKCASEMGCKIMSKVGADRVVFPENESGIRLARNLLKQGFVDIADLSENVSMIQMQIKPGWAGKTLRELDLRKHYMVNVVAMVDTGIVDYDCDPDRILRPDMQLIMLAESSKLRALI